jgi:uracil-DNA glycosylase family protein
MTTDENAARLIAVAKEAASCTRCDLYARATQTVFGEGPVHAELFFIGEQPGDQEDVQGAPFVGPAGRVLDEALEEAGIDRSTVYVTNAVKHFKWTPRGKRRIHEKPNRTEMVACHHWLEQELELVDPLVIVALGATAGQALWGSSFRVGAARGQELHVGARPAVATIHPSALLREREPEARAVRRKEFVDDLRRAEEMRAAS